MFTWQRGATAVAYSGGKCIRGPQAAGLLLGDKSLLQGAWINSAPHHAFGRSVKVGKEEIMGMLAAVEMWVKRDHKAEWAQWEVVAGSHRHQREARGRRHHQGQPALGGPLQPHARTADPVGRREARHHRAGGRQAAARHGAAHRGGEASGARPGNMASPSPSSPTR